MIFSMVSSISLTPFALQSRRLPCWAAPFSRKMGNKRGSANARGHAPGFPRLPPQFVPRGFTSLKDRSHSLYAIFGPCQRIFRELQHAGIAALQYIFTVLESLNPSSLKYKKQTEGPSSLINSVAQNARRIRDLHRLPKEAVRRERGIAPVPSPAPAPRAVCPPTRR